MNENGVVIGSVTYSLNARAPILAKINEHFGTSFTGWSDNEIALREGDTLSSWAAYEKILQPNYPKYGVQLAGDTYWIGFLDNEKIYHALSNGTSSILASNEGVITSISGPTIDLVRSAVISLMARNNIECNDAVFHNSSLAVGDTVPNWSDYTLIQ